MADGGWRKGIARSAGSSFILVVALADTLTGALAMAQELTDPTRPPAVVVTRAVEGESAPNQLQSVIITPTRKAAIINGVVVNLGGKYGDAVLTRVAEDEVVLKSGTSQQVLKLYPAVEKVNVAPPAAKSAPRKTKPKAKAEAQPKATMQQETKPTAGNGAGAR